MYNIRNPNIVIPENHENQNIVILSSSITMVTCKLNEIMRIFYNQFDGIKLSLIIVLSNVSSFVGEKLFNYFQKL